MTLPATEAGELLAEYASRLDDHSTALDPMTLQRIVKRCTDAISRAPSEALADLFSLKGTAYMRLGKYPDALAAYQNAARYDTRSASRANNLATALSRMNRPTEAMAAFDDAVNRARTDPTPRSRFIALLNRSSLLRKSGDTIGAARDIDAAEQIADPENHVDQWMLASCTAGLGRDNDAVEHAARFVAVVSGADRGDSPAPEFIHASPREIQERLMADSGIRAALARASQDVDSVEGAGVDAEIQISAVEWERLTAIVDNPPPLPDKLHRLFNEPRS